jgi:hypothetical protein
MVIGAFSSAGRYSLGNRRAGRQPMALVSNIAMPNSRSRLCLPLAALAILTGCATGATMDARYDQSLQHWRGATRAELLAAWGEPLLAQAAGGVETLTWAINDGIRNPQTLPVYTMPTIGAPTVGVSTVAPTTPARCTTRFELRDGVVTGWKFEGLSCGAPT